MTAESKGFLAAIVRFSLRFRGVIVALALVSTGYGVYSLSMAKYDVFPEFAPPQVVIQTEAPGLAPEQVEVLVTRPIEYAINGVEGIESLRSGSIQGLSVITVNFKSRSGIYLIRQMIAERLANLSGQLPQGVEAPDMTPLTSSTSVVMAIGLTSEKISLMELRTVAYWTVRNRLLAVPGVAKAVIQGGDVRQLQIQLHPDRLIQYNLAFEDVLAVAQRATGIRGAGFIDNDNQRIIFQTEGQSLTLDQLGNAVLIHQKGASVTLSDVAQIVEAPEPPVGAAAIMGRPGVVVIISSQYGANTLEVTQKVEQALGELRPILTDQGINLYPDIFRPANFIQTAIRNLRSSLLIGAVLVVLILFLFLFNVRTVVISLTAIPLSLLAAITVLNHMGFSLNTMTLGGLAIAIGEVVDDAVIDVENILRRLRENRQSEHPHPIFRVILEASIEVRSAVVFGTFSVVVVFIPILTISGVAGRLFSPLGVAYILSILASLLVALTVTPALCFLLLGRQDLSEKEPPVAGWLKERYRSLLAWVEERFRLVIAGVVLLILIGLTMVPFFGGEFLPELKEGHFIVHVSTVPGTSLQESLRLGRQVTLELLKIPYVRSVAQLVGRAEKGDEILGTHDSEFEVDLKPLKGEEAEFAESEIRNALTRFPGIYSAIKTFLIERVEETLSGYMASVVINIISNDLEILDDRAQSVARIVGKIPGAADVQVQSPPGTPQLMLKLRKGDLGRWGFLPVDVLEAVRTAYQGTIVGQVYEGDRVFDVAINLEAQSRKNISEVGTLPLRNSEGTYVHLRQLADIYETSGRYVVLHEGARRVQAVTFNVAGRDINSFVVEAKKQIYSSVSFPAGTYLEFGGAAKAQAQSRRDLLVYSLIVGIGIILLLSIVMGNYHNLILVLLNLPFALVGGVLVVFFTGGWLSIGSLVGFVTLFGISLRNSIMMISHYEHLVSKEGVQWGEEAALRGASERLVPILMTALVTALGLLPVAIRSGTPGHEIEGPMAMVILGGLLTSTALNLLVLPTLSLRYGRFGMMAQIEE